MLKRRKVCQKTKFFRLPLIFVGQFYRKFAFIAFSIVCVISNRTEEKPQHKKHLDLSPSMFEMFTNLGTRQYSGFKNGERMK